MISAYGDTNHDHAVTLAGTNTFGYDAIGNQTTRTEGGSSYTLAYDAENRLVGVSGAITASFVYDGDGNRVKGTIGTTTTTYVGNYFEWTGNTSTMIRYYYAGSSTLNYLMGDHLGSQSITTDSNGVMSAEIRYYPWGTERYSSGTTPTTYHFTGQRLESALGLYYYGARWYDPTAGRFIQADMIVPGGVQGLDRYAYTFNNPIKYKDPSGHSGCKDKHVAEGDCSDSSLTDILKEVYEVTLKRGTGDFSEEEIRAIYRGVQSVDNKLRDQVNGLVTGETFKEYFGSTTFLKGNRGAPGLSGECMGIDSGGCTSNANLINFVSMSGSSTNNITRMEHNVVHELGHSYDITRHYDPRNDMPSRIYENRGNILRPNDPQGRYDWQQNLTLNPSETFADMFIAWTYNVWNSDPINIDAVTDAQAWMTGMMK